MSSKEKWAARYFAEIIIHDEELKNRIEKKAQALVDSVGLPWKAPSEELMKIIFSSEDAIVLIEEKLDDAYKTYIESQIKDLEKSKAVRTKQIEELNEEIEKLRNEIS